MITRLLIANRGEIACRIIKTARATCDSVGRSDRSRYLSGGREDPASRRGRRSRRSPPGYGFLAENADFAQAVEDSGLTWVGPPPRAITAMGDKLRAKQLMEAAGVPILPSVTDPEQADTIGYPLIVKPVAGGGGKGMRVVTHAGDLDEAVAAAGRTAAVAFGDDRVFLERYLPRPRHIEVQVLADAHGTIVHLGERECSLQRRHQKLIEEAPSPAVDDHTSHIGDAAMAAIQAIEYRNAGTVEFIATQDDDGGLTFYFLEVNTRLQVEHPVTEQAWRVAGDPEPLDLVRCQLLVAEGRALPFAQGDLRLHGHAIEARVYAEDVAAGFLPATGPVLLLQPAGLPGVRWDSGVQTGDMISPHFDPMIAKVIATAPTRGEALRLLTTELRQTLLHGVTTNRDALVAMLSDPRVIAGDLDTTLVEGMSSAALAPVADPHTVAVHVIAATLAGQRTRRDQASVQRTIPTGWRNNRSKPDEIQFTMGDRTIDVSYAPTLPTGDNADGWLFTVDGEDWTVTLHEISGDCFDLTMAAAADGTPGQSDRSQLDMRLSVHATLLHPSQTTGVATDLWGVDSALGHASLVQVPRFGGAVPAQEAGSLVAPMPGSVAAVHVAEGARVKSGNVLLVLEAMKMEHPILAPHNGTVARLMVSYNDQVQAGDVLAVIIPGDTGA